MSDGEEEEESHRILEWLRSGQEPDQQQINQVRSASLDIQIAKDEELESGLRSLGVNRPERERARRRRHRQRPAAGDRDHDRQKARLRIAHYIDQLVDWTQTDIDRTEAILAWAMLSNHKVDLVNYWWSKGVHPLDFVEVTKLAAKGLQPTDLLVGINGRTIAEYLRAGCTAEWCELALEWALKSQRGASH